LLRHVLAGPLSLPSQGVGRITFGWDGPGKTWTLALEYPGQGESRKTRGRDPMPMLLDDLVRICQGSDDIVRHRSLLWFGVMDGKDLPDRAPWIGLQTPIDTAFGPVPAGELRPGDLLLTEDDDYAVLLSLQRMDLPSRGSFSPVILRAPYFGAETDILVSSDQLIALSGDEVEYLFSDETVLTEARNVTDGRAALMDLRRAVTSCVSLDIGAPRLILAENCRLLSHSHAHQWHIPSLPHLVIQGYETIPLLDMLGRTGNRSAA
jgi:hypothetical protein